MRKIWYDRAFWKLPAAGDTMNKGAVQHPPFFLPNHTNKHSQKIVQNQENPIPAPVSLDKTAENEDTIT